MLGKFGVNHVCRVLSAHRTPKQLEQFIGEMERPGVRGVYRGGGRGGASGRCSGSADGRAGAGGADGESVAERGWIRLLAMVQMPGGFGGDAGRLARRGDEGRCWRWRILANSRPGLREKLVAFRAEQAEKVLKETLP